MNKVIVISGATATGKTMVSIELAKMLDAEIVNFDSLLFYKELNIGTAKPTNEEMNGIIHHLIGIESAKNPINAADFVKLALPIIDDIHRRNKIVVLVGGSGFYLRALLEGMYESPTTPPEIMDKSNKLYNEEGIAPFIKILKENDPVSMNSLHENDHYRIRRAVEHFWATGKKFSDVKQQMENEKQNRDENIRGWDVFHAYLFVPKETHWQIMEKRAKEMVKSGLIDEVKELLTTGFSEDDPPLQSIGYKETIAYINGEIPSEEELIERIYINTRRLAKAQKTWFNKVEGKTTYNPLTDLDKLKKEVNNLKF